jgi:pimeloyl-ACP methyl ester carboxylesterase
MIDLLERADPARDLQADSVRLRAKVEERIGVSAPLRPGSIAIRRPWLVAAAAFVAVLAFGLPVLLRDQPPSVFAPDLEGIAAHPGVEEAVALASGGLQVMDTDGGTIWVMTTLQNLLQRISAESGEVEATYPIDARVEGVVAGGGSIWLISPDHGGEVLRFDPNLGVVDSTIPLGGAPGWSHWLGDALWVGTDQTEVVQISSDGEIVSTVPGDLKGGEGLGYLWVNDPGTDLISSLSESGEIGEIVIPTERGLDTMSGSGIRQVSEADGRLFLLDGDHPWGTNLNVFDPDSGDFGAFTGLTFGLLDLVQFDGYLWVTSSTDHLIIRIDPVTGEQRRYPMPGKTGGLVVADGALWVTLYQPGALLRLDTGADLIESSPVVADDWNRFPHRLLCTGTGEATGPTVILQPSDWIDYGSMSVIQAKLSDEGHLACTNGYVQGETTPEQQAADLDEALGEAGIAGPYLLVAAVDGVHAVRLFADGRDDIAGVVLIDPMPVGFQDFYDELLPDYSGHPPWLDLDADVSASLDTFGSVPLVVIEQDPQAVFLSPNFLESPGGEAAEAVNQYWQDGLAFYSGLSSDARSLVADDSGLDMIIWDQPDLVVEQVLELADPS